MFDRDRCVPGCTDVCVVDLEPDEDQKLAIPVKPTDRCLRCGAWLNSHNTDGDYCEPCHDAILRKHRPCGNCGEPFYHINPSVIRCESCQEGFERRKKTCSVCSDDFVPFTCTLCKGKKQRPAVCYTCHWREYHAEAAAIREHTCAVCGCSFLPRTCDIPECGERLSSICTVCHEEQAHSERRAEVWRLTDCPRCERAINALKKDRRPVVCRDLQKLVSGEAPDIDAMAHLAMSGGEAPLVRMDGRFLESHEIDELIGAALSQGGAV